MLLDPSIIRPGSRLGGRPAAVPAKVRSKTELRVEGLGLKDPGLRKDSGLIQVAEDPPGG